MWMELVSNTHVQHTLQLSQLASLKPWLAISLWQSSSNRVFSFHDPKLTWVKCLFLVLLGMYSSSMPRNHCCLWNCQKAWFFLDRARWTKGTFSNAWSVESGTYSWGVLGHLSIYWYARCIKLVCESQSQVKMLFTHPPTLILLTTSLAMYKSQWNRCPLEHTFLYPIQVCPLDKLKNQGLPPALAQAHQAQLLMWLSQGLLHPSVRSSVRKPNHRLQGQLHARGHIEPPIIPEFVARSASLYQERSFDLFPNFNTCGRKISGLWLKHMLRELTVYAATWSANTPAGPKLRRKP